MIRHVVRKFGVLRTALAVGAVIPLLAVTGAFAQEPAASPAAAAATTGATGGTCWRLSASSLPVRTFRRQKKSDRTRF